MHVGAGMFIFELFFDTFGGRVESVYMSLGSKGGSELAGEGLVEEGRP